MGTLPCFLGAHLSNLEMETFDETLDRNIWTLSDKRLKWDQEIAAKRRTKPREVEGFLGVLFEQQRGSESIEMEADGGNDDAEEGEVDREFDFAP
jgi:hypothetical protein